jgi:hypothetical protein
MQSQTKADKWLLRNIKSLVGFLVFFSSSCSVGYTLDNYLNQTKFANISDLLTVLGVGIYIWLFSVFVSIYRYEVDNKINLYDKDSNKNKHLKGYPLER